MCKNKLLYFFKNFFCFVSYSFCIKKRKFSNIHTVLFSSLDIPSNISEADFTRLLNSLPYFGSFKIVRSGSCSGYNWLITWTTGGVKDLFKVSILPQFIPSLSQHSFHLQLNFQISSSSLIGSSPTIRVTESKSGGVSFIPILDNWLTTVHSKPQVNVLINNIASKCLSNCGFDWIVVPLRPTVTSIDTSRLPNITVTGTNFDTNPGNNIIQIGNYTCVISQASSTQLNCTAGNIPAGQYNFTVIVADKVRSFLIANSLFRFDIKRRMMFFLLN